uniref:DUF4939 domain-containing protein n=1 Tax=Oncorhynchus tshawytscha TaxID=74940 RepID=A0AAZ3QBZ8_ONCTS
MGVSIFYRRCPATNRYLASYPATPSGAEPTSLVPVSGTCVPHSQAQGGSAPRMHCNAEGEWMVPVGGCICEEGYEPNQNRSACLALQTMERWERRGVTPASPPAQPVSPSFTPPSPGPSGIRLALPREFDGTEAGCQGFLLQLELYLATVYPAPSGRESVAALVSCLSGKALEWANTVWGEEEEVLDHFKDVSST